jgi:hypothetical protein
MMVRSPCNSPATPLFSLLAASATPKALPDGFKDACNGPAHNEREYASSSIHQMRPQAEDRRMAGVKRVEKPSAPHREEPENDPQPNSGAKAKMSQSKVSPRSSKSAPNQWEHQQTCI